VDFVPPAPAVGAVVGFVRVGAREVGAAVGDFVGEILIRVKPVGGTNGAADTAAKVATAFLFPDTAARAATLDFIFDIKLPLATDFFILDIASSNSASAACSD